MQKVTATEMAGETIELLPARETLLGDFNVAGVLASNSSVAANILAACSSANSVAQQGILVFQH